MTTIFSDILQNLLSLVLYPIYYLWYGIVGLFDLVYVPVAGSYNLIIDYLSTACDFITYAFSWLPNPAFLAIIILYIWIFLLYIMLWAVRNIKDLIFRWV